MEKLAHLERGRGAEHHAHPAALACLRINGYAAKHACVDLGLRRLADRIQSIEHAQVAARLVMRQLAGFPHAELVAQREDLLLLLGIKLLRHHLLDGDEGHVLGHAARVGEEVASRSAHDLARVVRFDFRRKFRIAGDDGARPNGFEQRDSRLDRRVDVRANHPVLAAFAAAVHQHDVIDAACGKLHEQQFLHAGQAGHGGIHFGVALFASSHARTGDNGHAPLGGVHGCSHGIGQVLAQGVDRMDGLHGAHGHAGTAGNALGHIHRNLVVSHGDGLPPAGLHAALAAGVAIAHGNAARIGGENGSAPKGLYQIDYFVERGHGFPNGLSLNASLLSP